MEIVHNFKGCPVITFTVYIAENKMERFGLFTTAVRAMCGTVGAGVICSAIFMSKATLRHVVVWNAVFLDIYSM